MYSEADMTLIKSKVRKNLLVLALVLAVLITGYVITIVKAVQWLMMVFGALIFVAICYAVIVYLAPNIRYLIFLKDMKNGLEKDFSGHILSVDEKEETQDGVRVLPVHFYIDADNDERLFYLNASKQELFKVTDGTTTIRCYGRHIKQVL